MKQRVQRHAKREKTSTANAKKARTCGSEAKANSRDDAQQADGAGKTPERSAQVVVRAPRASRHRVIMVQDTLFETGDNEYVVRKDALVINDGELLHWHGDNLHMLEQGVCYTDLDVTLGQGGNPTSVKIKGIEIDDPKRHEKCDIAGDMWLKSVPPELFSEVETQQANNKQHRYALVKFAGVVQVPKPFKSKKPGSYAAIFVEDKAGDRLLLKLWNYSMDAFEQEISTFEENAYMLLVNVKYVLPQGTFGPARSITRASKNSNDGACGLVLPLSGCLERLRLPHALSHAEVPEAECDEISAEAVKEAWGAAKDYDEADLKGPFHMVLEAIIVGAKSLSPVNAELVVAPPSAQCSKSLVIPASAYATVFGCASSDDWNYKSQNVTKALKHARDQGTFKFLLEAKTQRVLDVFGPSAAKSCPDD